MTSAPLLTLAGIKYHLGGQPILDGVDLSIAPGERLSLAAARGGGEVRPILVAPAELAEQDGTLGSLPFACVRYRWRGARAVFDGLDDALA